MPRRNASFILLAALVLAAFPLRVHSQTRGYAPQPGGGLTVSLSAGSVLCGQNLILYAGGTVALTASSINWVYLNPQGFCAPAAKTTALVPGDLPIAQVGTNAAGVTSLLDLTGSYIKPTGVSNSGNSTVNVTDWGAKGDNVADDAPAIQAAVNSCPATGCYIVFPSLSGQAKYKIRSTITFPTQVPVDVRCGNVSSDQGQNTQLVQINVGNSNPLGTPFIGFDFAQNKAGTAVHNCAFTDTSTGNINTAAIKLEAQQNFWLDNDDISGFSSTVAGNGNGVLLDGSAATTQFGLISNLRGAGNQTMIETKGTVTSVVILGGQWACAPLGPNPIPAGSIGIDLGENDHPAGVSTGGENKIIATQIQNCNTGYALYNQGGTDFIAPKIENTTATQGTGYLIDGDGTTRARGTTLEGFQATQMTTGVQVNALTLNTAMWGFHSNGSNTTDFTVAAGAAPTTWYDGAYVPNAGSTLGALGLTAAPTISSGFGTGPSVTASYGVRAFRINVGTGGTASSGVIGLPTAATGWNCQATDITTATAAVDITKQTASSTTTATIGNFTSGGLAGAWAASDILAVSCAPF